MHGAVYPTQCGISFFGCEQVVFASDTPFRSAVNAAAAIDRLELDPQSKRRIFSQNAEKLLF
jgi:predicted TIM-barrel fold metal-dependent hydrolase